MTAAPEHTSSQELWEQARHRVERLQHELDQHVTDTGTLQDTVAGVHTLSEALAELVASLMKHIPAAVPGDADRRAAEEVIADLRAMHGCLTTGVLLLEPTLQDLRGLTQATPISPTAPPELDI